MMQTRLLSWVSNPVVQLTIVLLVAAVLRLSHLWYAETLPMFSEPTVDAAVYHERAIAISSGDWMLGGAPLRMSPGYHYLLGAVYSIFGSGSWPIRIVQMIAGVLTVAFVWDTARRLFGVPWAWLPALAMAAYGPAIFYESARLATTAALGVHALLLWLVVATLQRADGRLISWLVIGALWGVCCTIRPNALLLGLPIGLAAAGLLTSWRGALGAAALLRVAVTVLAARSEFLYRQRPGRERHVADPSGSADERGTRFICGFP